MHAFISPSYTSSLDITSEMHNRPLDDEISQPQDGKPQKRGYADLVSVAVPSPSAAGHPPLLTDLPTECLQLVASHFEGDLSGLHSLLRTNRLFFRLAVPLLYRSPFQLVRDYDGDKLPWDKYKRQVKLLWVLLCSVIHHPWVAEELPPFSADFPTLCAPGYGITTQTATGGSRRKELTTDYLQFYNHQDHASISDAFPSLFPSLVCYQMEQWTSSNDMHRIRACIEKAFLMHHPERIHSLSIPVTRVRSTFLEAVGQLRRLRRVEFYDIKLDFDPKEAVEFLKRHQYPGKDIAADDRMTPCSEILPSTTTELTEIKIGGTGDCGVIGKTDLYKILQSMHRPEVIDLTGWRGAVMDIAQIPVQFLRSLFLRLDPPLPIDSPVQKFLESARHLRELQICIAPNHGGLFRWAVEKRRASLEADRQKDKILLNPKEPERRRPSLIVQDQPRARRIESVGSMGSVVEDQRRTPSTGLEVLSIAGETQAVVWALMGATEAYPESLRTLKASSWKRSVNLDLEEEDHHHPHQDAHAVVPGSAYVAVDPYPYGQVAPPEPSPPQFLPQMPQHLAQSPLDTLTNGSHTDEGGHIHADIPLLCFTPIMTRLVHLELKGEVAALAFDFRSLSHCPQLLVLILNTRPCGIEPHSTSVMRLLDNAPRSLQQLELMGPWFVTDTEMERMSQPTGLPDLRRLRMVHCKTSLPMENRVWSSMVKSQFDQRLTTRGLFGAVKKMTQLRELELGLDMDQQHLRHRSQGSIRPRFDQTLPEDIPSLGNGVQEGESSDKDDLEDREGEDLEWSVLPRLLQGLNRHRIVPLHFDIQHWSP